MGLFGDLENAADEFTSGAHTSPTPQVHGAPPSPVTPRTWTAPTVGASGHITVHHGTLTTAADVLKNCVPDLETALEGVNQQTLAFDSLTGWDTGASFGGNLVNAVSAFLSAGQDTSQSHATAATSMSSTAATYDSTETANAHLSSSGNGSSSGAGWNKRA
jgi:hypothetical protein